MKTIEVEIHADGTTCTRVREWKKIYKNEQGYSVFEGPNGRLEVFDTNKKSSLHGKLEVIGTLNWLNDRYFKKIIFYIHTEKQEQRTLAKMKKYIKKYFDENFGFIGKIDYEAIKLPE